MLCMLITETKPKIDSLRYKSDLRKRLNMDKKSLFCKNCPLKSSELMQWLIRTVVLSTTWLCFNQINVNFEKCNLNDSFCLQRPFLGTFSSD